MKPYDRCKRLFLAGVGAVLLGVMSSLPLLAQGPIDNTFTYQGRLLRSGHLVDESCAFRFRLYDDPGPAGSLLGTQTISAVTVTGGYFTVTLNDTNQFGASAFTGSKRYLAIEVQCSGDANFVALDSQRVELTALPYALYAQNVDWGNILNRPPGLDDGDNASVYTAGFGLTLDTSNKFEVNDSVIQRRIGSQCNINEAIRSVNLDGTVTCEIVAQFGADVGLILDPVTKKFRVNFSEVQKRLQPSPACPPGQTIRDVNQDGVPLCQNAVTGLVAGTGLSSDPSTGIGGATSGGQGIIRVATGGITTSLLANSAVVKDKIANNAVDSSKIENGSIKAEDIGSDCTSGQILKSTGNNIWVCGQDAVDNGNADQLDNLDSSQFLRSDATDQYSAGTLTFNSGATLDVNGILQSDGTFNVNGATNFSFPPAFQNIGPPFSVANTSRVDNLNVQYFDSLASASFLRSDTNDSYTNGTFTFGGVTILNLDGTTNVNGNFTFNSRPVFNSLGDPFTVNNTNLIDNLNADQLDGYQGASFFVLNEDETVTGVPAFNGGVSGLTPPFTVDSSTLVNSLNADLLDGNQGSFYQNADNLSSGTVSTARYSARADLAAEGYLGNAAGDIAQNNGVVQPTLNADLLDGLDSTAFVSSSRAINSGAGLTGGGDLSADRTLAVNFGDGANQVAPGNHNHLGQTWTGSGATGLKIEMTDSAVALAVENDGGGPIFEAYDGNNRRFYIDGDGDVFADRGYHCGLNNQISTASVTATNNSVITVIDDLGACLNDNSPADFAEMLPAADTAPLEPGDVLVIGPDGQLTRSTEAYQTSVVGVYSTRPSYLGNSRFAGQDGYAPLAIVGVVPVKASAENGPIQPGDMLVASATPGHAMRAEPVTLNGITFYPSGISIGKALEPLDAGAGLIQMLVTLQ